MEPIQTQTLSIESSLLHFLYQNQLKYYQSCPESIWLEKVHEKSGKVQFNARILAAIWIQMKRGKKKNRMWNKKN